MVTRVHRGQSQRRHPTARQHYLLALRAYLTHQMTADLLLKAMTTAPEPGLTRARLGKVGTA
jgi:hypothetical protein